MTAKTTTKSKTKKTKSKKTKVASFGECADRALKKHFQKAIQHEAGVREDADPEELHQMRVGMRRLRSTLQTFRSAVAIPTTASEKKIGKIGRVLGAVRDADVMSMVLQERYAPALDGKERKRFDRVLSGLQKQRHRDFSKMERTLNSSLYHNFKQEFETWLDAPQHGPPAALPILEVLPDLMLPLVGNLFLHPGWWVGTDSDSSDPQAIGQFLDRHESSLHDLRKQMKRVRYQSEFFADYYTEIGDAIAAFKEVQECLGELQDRAVLRDFLNDSLDKDIEDSLPTLAQCFQQERVELWGKWEPLRDRFLDLDFRRQLRSAILNPVAP